MANPFLNEKAADEAAAGWAAPTGSARSTPIPGTAGGSGTWAPPISDGPVTTWHQGTFTVSGAASATGVLLVVLLAAAAFGWASVTPLAANATQAGFPGLALVGVLVGFACAIAVRFKPMLSKYLAPIYALGEGYFVGVISHYYNDAYHGIVLQAVGATLGVFAAMLFLYKTRIIKVNDRFRRIVFGAMMGLMAFYLITFVISLFNSNAISFYNNGSLLGIGISIFAAGLAAMMLAVDFDMIERGQERGWPKGMEWYAAFSLLITLVWLYLEMLRLIAQLNRRR